jgi:hypothetical protein
MRKHFFLTSVVGIRALLIRVETKGEKEEGILSIMLWILLYFCSTFRNEGWLMLSIYLLLLLSINGYIDLKAVGVF